MINLAALIIPWLELIAGLCLIFAVLEVPSLIIINGLIVMFTLVVGVSLIRGLDIHCGCFTTSPDAKSDMAQVLARDIILLAAGLSALTLRLNLSRPQGSGSSQGVNLLENILSAASDIYPGYRIFDLIQPVQRIDVVDP